MMLVLTIYLIHLSSPSKYGSKYFKDAIMLLFGVHVIFQLHFVLKIVSEVSSALKIRVFFVKK